MNKPHSNPFKFGNPVEGEYYLPRPTLAKTITQFLSNGIHVVLIGPRRFGKTSFVLNLLHELESQSYICIPVDIFNITSHRDFLQQLLRALAAKVSLWKKIKSFGITMEHCSDADVKETIQNALAELSQLGDRVVLAIDEFQKICEIEDHGWLEATLRTHMQRPGTSFLFTGSRKSLIYDMLNNHSRPLYRSCQSIEFPSFGEEFTDWVVTRFHTVGIKCERKAIQDLRRCVQDTPNYVQMVGFHLVAENIRSVTCPAVEKALAAVVRQNDYAYHTLLHSLTLTQQRALKLAAREGKQLFQKQLLTKYEIASAAALASAFKALKAKGVLDEEGIHKGSVAFDDPLFAMWLKSS
jgi:hypothetical protein